MSGSGGGGGGSGGGGGGGGIGGIPEPTCANLFFRTTLNSPNPAVLRTLTPKDVLKLVPKTATGPLLAVDAHGKTAGSITSAFLAKLLSCIDEGYEYVAVVTAVKGGICEVDVRPRGK